MNFGRIEAQVDIAEAQEKQAYFSFKQTVLLAIEEVENAFFGYLRETERQEMFAEIAREQSEAAEVAREQYLNGIAPQLDLLNAEQSALTAETNAVISKTEAAINLIRLYTALGYGSKKLDTKLDMPKKNKKDTNKSTTQKMPLKNQEKKAAIYPQILPKGVDPNIYW